MQKESDQGVFLLVPAHWGRPGQSAVKWLCVVFWFRKRVSHTDEDLVRESATHLTTDDCCGASDCGNTKHHSGDDETNDLHDCHPVGEERPEKYKSSDIYTYRNNTDNHQH